MNGRRVPDIMVTLGPASYDESMIRAFLDLGVDQFRFPFAKETPALHMKWSAVVKSFAERLGRRVLLFADLPGGKPRLNNTVPIEIDVDREYVVRLDNTCTTTAIDFGIESQHDLGRCPVGAVLVIGDGENRFTVEREGRGWIAGHFAEGGILERRRAFIPVTPRVFACFTDYDRECAEIVRSTFDGVVLSFVSSAAQIESAREWLRREIQWRPLIVAKIETNAALENLDAIIATADRVLIGRGDLTLQIGPAALWDAQKAIIQASVRAGRHVTIGTGILQSMHYETTPTRAECVDVSAAIELGVNGFMFASETAVGKWPVKIVETLRSLTAR